MALRQPLARYPGSRDLHYRAVVDFVGAVMGAPFDIPPEYLQHLARRAERWMGHCILVGRVDLAEFYRADADKYAQLAAERLPSIRRAS